MKKQVIFLVASLVSVSGYISSADAGVIEVMNLTNGFDSDAWQDITHFQSGVFELNNSGNRVIPKCHIANGQWIHKSILYAL